MKKSHGISLATGALLAALLLPMGAVQAGGPLVVNAAGAPYVFSTAAPIPYRTDNGPLSASVTEAAARARVASMFGVWTAVPTANISYARATTDGGNGAGFINPAPAPLGGTAFVSGDVDTVDEYNAVEANCSTGAQSPIVYDVDGSIFAALGLDNTMIIGFAGPCSITDPTVGLPQYGSGRAVMNGLFQDGQPAPVADLTAAEFDTAFIHEFGHFSGLDHSQINVNCLGGCGGIDIGGLPTMFPILFSAAQGVLHRDDIAWISKLYPQTTGGTTFANTHGTITGTVFFSDGQSHAQGVNVIARPVNAGGNEDRTNAVSVVTGYKFRVARGNSINDSGSPFGSLTPSEMGLFEIPVPAGSYTVEVESIDSGFDQGSSVGPLNPPIPMPGSAPAPSATFAVAAGATSSGHDFILIGTDPRFDQFEGP